MKRVLVLHSSEACFLLFVSQAKSQVDKAAPAAQQHSGSVFRSLLGLDQGKGDENEGDEEEAGPKPFFGLGGTRRVSRPQPAAKPAARAGRAAASAAKPATRALSGAEKRAAAAAKRAAPAKQVRLAVFHD